MNATWALLLRVHRYPQYSQLLWWRLRGGQILRAHRVTAGQDIRFHGLPILQSAEAGSIRLGSRVVLCSDSAYTALGVARPVILRTLLPGARLSIGDDSGLSGTVICAAQSVSIGRRCLFGADVMVVDTDFHPLEPPQDRCEAPLEQAARAAVVVGDDVFIGARSIILKGVTIGAGAVVGAGSVVVSDIPAHSIAAGSPARVVSMLGKG